MTASRSQPVARESPAAHVVMRRWGVGILLVGLLAASLVYVLAADDDGDGIARIAGAKMYQHNLALIGGKAAVAADRFDRWFGGLWHGRPLAYTIAVLAIAIAAGCFWVARIITMPIPPQAIERERDGR